MVARQDLNNDCDIVSGIHEWRHSCRSFRRSFHSQVCSLWGPLNWSAWDLWKNSERCSSPVCLFNTNMKKHECHGLNSQRRKLYSPVQQNVQKVMRQMSVWHCRIPLVFHLRDNICDRVFIFIYLFIFNLMLGYCSWISCPLFCME